MIETIQKTKVLIVAGKGGVGKSTLAATIASAAAFAKRKTVLVCLGESPITAELSVALQSKSEPFNDDLRLDILKLRPEEILIEYLEDHGMASMGRRLISSGVVSVIATAVPGIRELLILAKLKQMERSGEYDTIVLDAPASGHLLTFLSSPKGLSDIANVGLLKTQSQEVEELLKDPSRSRLIMVSLAEETPVLETIETISRLRDLSVINLGPVIINQVINPPSLSDEAKATLEASARSTSIAAAYQYIASRSAMQVRNLELLGRSLNETDTIQLPFLFTTQIRIQHIVELARLLNSPSVR
ncbi:ArsA family ATPase [Acidithrix ferrooxidans]|uniref:Arsenical pump-driving ATPase n=1 Tax=Acidithrix ferrooxidans TaxID=1280514 RepID=A0A0D8HP90_9ACTN|nr:ArsA-related P-loop ATPase [Acidithrix ferrooxidans]KJF18926.1 arsenical pump-driving ATPase [Acidithrix ferrooxidans]